MENVHEDDSASREEFLFPSFRPADEQESDSRKLEEQRSMTTVTGRRRDNRTGAEGDEVFELWTEVPSSFLHPLHSDSGNERKNQTKRR